MIKNLNYFFQSIIIYVFFIIGRLIGLKAARKVFSNLFLKIGPKFKSNKVIEKNLKIFNKNLSQRDKEKIQYNMWKNYGMTFIEYIFLGFFRNQNKHITVKGEDNLKTIIGEQKQVIFVSGHFANYELMSMEITKRRINLATIYRPLNNIFLNPLMEYLRRKHVCKNQIKKGLNGVRDAIDYLKKDFSVALMIDQRVTEGEKINFFGEPAFTTTLPAQLSIKYNLPIIPVSIKRIDDIKFVVTFHDQIKATDFNNKISLSKKLNEVLENMIKENPDQWIWTHNRWK